MLGTNKDFFGVFTAWAYGSAAGLTAVKRGKVQTMQTRRRGVLPKGAAPEYWRKVYSVCEMLWNDLPDADKRTWLYGWKKYGNTGRDEFGHWNTNLIGRWESYLKTRPGTQGTEKRKTNYPGSVPLPPQYSCLLPGTWTPWSGPPVVVDGRRRLATGSGHTIMDAYIQACGFLALNPWGLTDGQFGGNFARASIDYPPVVMVQIVQRWTTIRLASPGAYAWRNQKFKWWSGSTSGFCGDAPYLFNGEAVAAGVRTVDWPGVVAAAPAVGVSPSWNDPTDWAPPMMPTEFNRDFGWNIANAELAYDGRV